ncbi:hypothetical protein BCR44DRAFT_225425 [Catenaria anguillulae PL171]|uniref:Uncharacterized protein n=1 Tax=Catenaria anguillulae PL171 TaxID=765915 RepID=A0A1Y2HF15_9FUNG|nr:hypothetical protein BCR44DRAFT_225425 [Catenaria anguillulae PL171]
MTYGHASHSHSHGYGHAHGHSHSHHSHGHHRQEHQQNQYQHQNQDQYQQHQQHQYQNQHQQQQYQEVSGSSSISIDANGVVTHNGVVQQNPVDGFTGRADQVGQGEFTILPIVTGDGPVASSTARYNQDSGAQQQQQQQQQQEVSGSSSISIDENGVITQNGQVVQQRDPVDGFTGRTDQVGEGEFTILPFAGDQQQQQQQQPQQQQQQEVSGSSSMSIDENGVITHNGVVQRDTAPVDGFTGRADQVGEGQFTILPVADANQLDHMQVALNGGDSSQLHVGHTNALQPGEFSIMPFPMPGDDALQTAVQQSSVNAHHQGDVYGADVYVDAAINVMQSANLC